MNKIPRVITKIETSREFGRALLRGIAKYSRLNGPWLFYSEPQGLETALPNLSSWHPNGAIIRDSNRSESRKVITMGLPSIVALHVREQFTDLPVIATNSREIGRMAAEHLIDSGFRSFGFCGLADMWWSAVRRRSSGRCRAMWKTTSGKAKPWRGLWRVCGGWHNTRPAATCR